MEEQIETQRKAQTDARSEAAVQASARLGRGAFHRSAGSRTFAPASLTPFVIGSEAVLRELAEKVNGGETWAGGDIAYGECAYELTADIALASGWTPVGTEEHPFTGIFDGNGFVIRGVETDGQGPEDRGLFGYIKGGTVEDLGVVDADIRGGKAAGAVAGTLYGGTIRRCYSTGYVAAADNIVMSGGIVGLSDDGSVMDCYSAANIEGSNVGGIVGYTFDSKIENCYSTGSITAYQVAGNSGFAGGLTGVLEPYKGVIVTNSVSLNPTLDIGKGFGVNRVIGFLYALEPSPAENSVFRDNYAFSGMKVNGIILSGGTHDNGNGADFSYDAASKTFSTPWEDIFSDASAWDIEPGRLPSLKGLGGQDGEIPEWLVNGTTADLYIGSAAELKAFRDRVNGADGEAADSFAGKTVRLTADITLDGSEEWTPIGLNVSGSADKPFSGVFDGNGHVIGGVTIRSDYDSAGLFGLVEEGSIQNLGVKDVSIRSESYLAGAVAGEVWNGAITNCYSTGAVNVNNERGTIGGIAGVIAEEPHKPESKIENCYSTAMVTCENVAGGIAGAVEGTVKNCYFAGREIVITGNEGGRPIAGGVAGSGAAGGTFIINCAALNSNIDNLNMTARILYDTTACRNTYAFSGMKLNGSPITNGDPNHPNGADLTFDPATKEFSTPWETIFDRDTSAWDLGPGKLPTLKGLGGQDGTIPEWLWEREKASLLIGNATDLIAFRHMVNGTGGMRADDFEGKTVRLTADIRLTEEWIPIGFRSGNGASTLKRPFKGVFDGNGYRISGLFIHDEGMSYAGLFANVDGGTVKNLGLKGVEIKAGNSAGAVVGFLENGTLRNCFSEGNIITIDGNAGGLAGAVAGSEIKNCYSKGSVVTAGPAPAGGIAGMIGAGESHVEHCYSAGSVAAVGRAGGLAGSMGASEEDGLPLSGTVRQNAALIHSLEGRPDSSGRIAGNIGTAPLNVISLEQNHAFSGMKVNGVPAAGDDGTGPNGMDGSFEELVLDQTIFPASDWVLEEGCYPMLKVFADRGAEPAPLERWLVEQTEGRFGIEVEAPASHTFPDAAEGYGKRPEKTVVVVNTGTDATGELTVTLAEQEKNGRAKPAGDGDYFVLAGLKAGGGSPGEAVSFTVAPVSGLKAGVYTARLQIAGNYGLSASYEVRFTVLRGSGSQDDGSSAAPERPEYTVLTGEVPSSAGTGDWVKQPGGGWKFQKQVKADAGSGAGGISGMAGGPGVSAGMGAGAFAAKEWLLIDGSWFYLMKRDGW